MGEFNGAMAGIVVVGWLGMDHFLDRSGELMGTGVGGKATNQAHALAQLGNDVSLTTVIGDDLLARTVVRQVDERNDLLFGDAGRVHLRYAKRAEGPTPVVELSDGAADWAVSITVGVSALLDEDDIVHAIKLQAPKVVSVTAELGIDVIEITIRQARAHGIPVAVTAAPAIARESTGAFTLTDIDVLTLNEHEARALTGLPEASTSEILRELQDMGARGWVAVTHGERGASYVDGGGGLTAPQFFHQNAYRGGPHTTGAGDAFTAAVVHAKAQGWPLSQGVAVGQWLGAQTSQTAQTVWCASHPRGVVEHPVLWPPSEAVISLSGLSGI